MKPFTQSIFDFYYVSTKTVSPEGLVMKEYFPRGDSILREDDSCNRLLKTIKGAQREYRCYHSLDDSIDIVAPHHPIPSRNLMKWMTVSGVAKLFSDLVDLTDTSLNLLQEVMSVEALTVLEILSKEQPSYWTTSNNMIVDEEIIITKRRSRRYHSVSGKPLVVLCKNNGIDLDGALRSDTIDDHQYNNAKRIAWNILKENFFDQLPPKLG